MSNRAITAVQDYSEATGAAYALLLTIADGVDSSADNMHGRNVPTLARKAHLHRWDATEEQRRNARRRCQRLLTKLIAAGELIVETGGYRTKSVYHIPILSGELGYDPQPCEATDHDCNHFHTSLAVSREKLITEDADRRKNADRLRHQPQTYVPRDAAPEPPQTRPLSRPSRNMPRDAAPEPPQTRPIDHGGAAPEPPQTRPLSRPVSHTYPIRIPEGIPEAPTQKQVEDEGAPEPTPPPAPPLAPTEPPLAAFRRHYPDVTAWARKTGRRWYATARENEPVKWAYNEVYDEAEAAQREWEAVHPAQQQPRQATG